jgi:hypothetical protein
MYPGAAADGRLISAFRWLGCSGRGLLPGRLLSWSFGDGGRGVGESPEDVIRKELGPSERLLWSGRPRQGFVLRASDAFLIPFSIMWGGFAIFWEASVISRGAPFFFMLWGVPFVLVGLYIMVGRFWVDARQRAATFYGVTSERVVIVSGVFARGVKSLGIDTLTDVSLTERVGGGGTITFGSVPFGYGLYAGTGWPFGQAAVPNFDLSDGARGVYEIIRGSQQAAKRHAEPG